MRLVRRPDPLNTFLEAEEDRAGFDLHIADAVQARLRNLGFTSTTFTPSLTPQTVRTILTDGDSGDSNMPTQTINLV